MWKCVFISFLTDLHEKMETTLMSVSFIRYMTTDTSCLAELRQEDMTNLSSLRSDVVTVVYLTSLYDCFVLKTSCQEVTSGFQLCTPSLSTP